MKINDAVFGAVFLLLGVVVLFHIQAFPKIPGQPVGPALFPGRAVRGTRRSAASCSSSAAFAPRNEQPWYETAEWMRSGRHFIAFAAIVAGVAAYVLFANSVGFLIVAPILLFVWLSVLAVRPLPALVVAVLATLVIWYAFYKLLRVPLPWGIMTGIAF